MVGTMERHRFQIIQPEKRLLTNITDIIVDDQIFYLIGQFVRVPRVRTLRIAVGNLQHLRSVQVIDAQSDSLADRIRLADAPMQIRFLSKCIEDRALIDDEVRVPPQSVTEISSIRNLRNDNRRYALSCVIYVQRIFRCLRWG